jgi:ubiquitin conjugation factor E4 B
MYYKGQERSSRAFLTLATTTLDFLLNLTKDVSAPFVQVPETKQRLSAMLLHFFEILCGPRCIDLKVKNPEKYAFNPKDLLGKIASIALSFSHYEEIQEIMANDIDYNAAVMQKAHHFLTREKILPAKDCQQFNDFINALDMIGKLRSRQEQEQHSNMDVDQSTIPLQASADDPMDVDHEVAEGAFHVCDFPFDAVSY